MIPFILANVELEAARNYLEQAALHDLVNLIFKFNFKYKHISNLLFN